MKDTQARFIAIVAANWTAAEIVQLQLDANAMDHTRGKVYDQDAERWEF